MDRFAWFLQKANIDYKQHQYDGVQWCVNNETRNDLPTTCRGGFIADEMGLGKTITMIAVLICNLLPRTLIVLPNVLIEQWTREIRRTTGHEPLIFYGPDKKNITIQQFRNAPIVITSYNTVTISLKKNNILHKIKWSRIVFDEAHHLRNKNSRFCASYSLHASIRWLISGTPIQNKLRDFFNLCHILRMPSTFYKNKDNIPSIIQNYVLKRSKTDAGVSLPILQLQNSSVLWNTDFERILSEDIHNAAHLSSPKDKLVMLIKARQVCILPAMLTNYIPQLIDEAIIPDDHDHDNALSLSSKMDSVIHTLLSRAANGNGKLIFCHFRHEIDTIVHRLQQNGISNITTFDGRTHHSLRAKKLSSGFEFLVLQIQTGCEGLNLQADFSEIYFISPHWNPAIEEQAIARCHRIGQTKPVHVFRFQMTSFDKEIDDDSNPSIEQYISLVQNNKREIANHMFYEHVNN